MVFMSQGSEAVHPEKGVICRLFQIFTQINRLPIIAICKNSDNVKDDEKTQTK